VAAVAASSHFLTSPHAQPPGGIPKKVRDALRLVPGDGVEFGVNTEGQVVALLRGAAVRRA